MRIDGRTAKQNNMKKSVGAFWENARASESRLDMRILTTCRPEKQHIRIASNGYNYDILRIF